MISLRIITEVPGRQAKLLGGAKLAPPFPVRLLTIVELATRPTDEERRRHCRDAVATHKARLDALGYRHQTVLVASSKAKERGKPTIGAVCQPVLAGSYR